MKYINKKYYFIFTCALLITLSGCKKYIELTPQDSTYDEVFWTSGANAEKALAGAYGKLRTALRMDNEGIGFITGDLTTDMFELGGDYWNYTDLSYNKNNNYNYAPYLENNLWDWTRFYAIINQCHLVVEHLADIPDSKFDDGLDQKKKIEGEARFLRAYTYFYMTKIWGDPVLTKESLKDPSNVAPIARSPEKEVLDYCIEDLKIAATLLPATNSDGKVRASSGAANATLAQIYAWRHDYPNALIYCDKVINSNSFSLVPVSDYRRIWQGNSVESIFEINMLYNQDNNEASGGFFARFLHDPLIKNKSVSSSWYLKKGSIDYLFPDTSLDKRYKQIVGLENTGAPVLMKYSAVKYYDPNNQPNAFVVNNNLVMIRLADIYLLKAEAAFKTGNIGAAQGAENIVRGRAGLKNTILTGDDFYNELLEERIREMVGEGTVMFDIIRMEQFDYWLAGAFSPARIAAKGYYWPLHMRKLLPQDPLLVQNLWWKNH